MRVIIHPLKQTDFPNGDRWSTGRKGGVGPFANPRHWERGAFYRPPPVNKSISIPEVLLNSSFRTSSRGSEEFSFVFLLGQLTEQMCSQDKTMYPFRAN